MASIVDNAVQKLLSARYSKSQILKQINVNILMKIIMQNDALDDYII